MWAADAGSANAMLVLSLLVATLVPAGGQTQAGAPWPTFRNASRPSAYVGPKGPHVAVEWAYNVASAISSSPTVSPDGATVYVSGVDTRVIHAVDAATGARRWTYTSPYDGALPCSPGFERDGTPVWVAHAVNGAATFGLNPSTGSVSWSQGHGGSYSSVVVGADGSIIFGKTYNQEVSCLSGGTRAQRWAWHAPQWSRSSVAIGETAVYVQPELRFVTALRYDNGAVLWQTTTTCSGTNMFWEDYKLSSSPTIAPWGAVLIGMCDGLFYALNTTTGAKLWTRATGAPIFSSPVLSADGEAVFFGSDDGNVYALNARNGSLLWSAATGGVVISSPSIDADGTLYIGGGDGCMRAYESATGKLLWRFNMTARILASPAVGPGGRLYAASDAGRTLALIDLGASTATASLALGGCRTAACVNATGVVGTLTAAGRFTYAAVCDPASPSGAWLRSWTNATLLTATVACQAASMTANYSLAAGAVPGAEAVSSADAVKWLWLGSAMAGTHNSFPWDCLVAPTYPPAAVVGVARVAWGDVLTVTAPFLGAARPAAVRLSLTPPPAPAAPSYLTSQLCPNLTIVDADTISCRVRYLPAAWAAAGAMLSVAARLDAAVTTPLSLASAGGWVPLGVTVQAVGSLIGVVPAGTRLSIGGGTSVMVTVPQPPWSPAEAAEAAFPEGAAAPRLVIDGVAGAAQCTAAPGSPNGTMLVCPAPAGGGIARPAMLTLGAVANITLPPLSFVAPTVASAWPSYVQLPQPPAPITVTATFNPPALGVGEIRNVSLLGAACTTAVVDVANGTVTCTVASSAALEAPWGTDVADLVVAFDWDDAVVVSPPLGKVVTRPVIQAIVPSLVSAGNVIVVVGRNLCPPSGCETSGGGRFFAAIGQYNVTADVTLVTEATATVVAPTVSELDASFPRYPLEWVTSVGARARVIPTLQYIATGTVVNASVLPSVFIPGDITTGLPVDEDIVVRMLPANSTVTYAAPFSCSLTSPTVGVLLLPPEGMPSLTGVRSAGAANVVSFGRIRVQALFSVTRVQLTAACTPDATDVKRPQDLAWTVSPVPLQVVPCAPIATASRSQEVLPAWTIAIAEADLAAAPGVCDVGSQRVRRPLPPITCTAALVGGGSGTAASGGTAASLLGGVEDVELATSMATFASSRLSGRIRTSYNVTVACSIGSITIPPAHRFTVLITSCPAGQYAVGTICVACPSASWSAGDAEACTSCPAAGATCRSGIIALQEGYFRPPEEVGLPLDAGAQLLPCAMPEGCVVNNTAQSHTCAPGYTGALCGVCDAAANYARVGDACVPCLPSSSNDAILGIGGVAVALLIGAYVVRKSGRAAGGDTSASIALRTLLTHVQMVSSLKAFRLGGTAVYKQVFSFTDAFSIAALSQGPTACSLRPSFATSFYLSLAAPVIVTAVAMLVLAIGAGVSATRAVGVRGGSRSLLASAAAELRDAWASQRHIAILISVLHVAYMPICSICLKTFNCTPAIAGTRHLTSDLREPCSGPRYIVVASTAGIVLAVLGLGYPLFLAVKLSGTPLATLRSQSFVAVWGFIFAGYKQETSTSGSSTLPPAKHVDTPGPPGLPTRRRLSFRPMRQLRTCLQTRLGHSMVWWESAIMLRKLLTVLIANAFSSDAVAQALVFVLVLEVFIVAYAVSSPYLKRGFNYSEGVSLAACFVTAVISVLVIEGKDDPTRTAAATAILIAVNAVCMLILLAQYAVSMLRQFATSRQKPAAAGVVKLVSASPLAGLPSGRLSASASVVALTEAGTIVNPLLATGGHAARLSTFRMRVLLDAGPSDASGHPTATSATHSTCAFPVPPVAASVADAPAVATGEAAAGRRPASFAPIASRQ